jgi:DNA-binding GntR family transcriptional regulator
VRVARTGQADGARYREIESWLRERCQALPAGSLLPSEQELSDRFGVSRMTARHAVQVLAQAGLVERRRGAGTFVAPPPLHRGEAILNSFTQEMLSRGLVPSSRVLRAEVGTAPREAAVLGLPPESWVVRIDRVRYASGVPVALEKAVLPGECEPVLGFDLERGSLHAALASLGRRMGRATGYVTARLASAEEAQLLDLTTPAALLVETRLITDVSGRPAESTETAYAGSRWVIDTGAFVAPPVPATGPDGSPAGSSAG